MSSSLQWLWDRFELFQHSEAIAGQDVRWNYSDLISEIQIGIRTFRNSGIKSGDVVILESPDHSPEAITALFSLWALSTIVVPISQAHPMRRESCEKLFPNAWVCHFDKRSGESERNVISIRRPHVELSSYRYPLLEKLRSENRPGLVLMTSGTTGEPKAALHDVSRLLGKYQVKLRPAMRTLGFLMFDHMGGIDTLAYTLTGGGCFILLPSLTRDPETVARTVEAFQVELLSASPTFFNHLLLTDCIEPSRLSTLKRISYGTETMPGVTLERLRKKLPWVSLSQSYGTTELGVPGTRSIADDSAWIAIGGSGVDARIENNELYVRSPYAMIGYLNAPYPFDEDGWYATGDLVETDPSGRFYRILGRKSDLINVGGEKVSPAEVEAVILRAPNIRDVRVTSQPNPLIGSMIVAHVVLNQPEPLDQLSSRLRLFCQKSLAAYQIPIKFQAVPEIERTSRGKIPRI